MIQWKQDDEEVTNNVPDPATQTGNVDCESSTQKTSDLRERIDVVLVEIRCYSQVSLETQSVHIVRLRVQNTHKNVLI